MATEYNRQYIGARYVPQFFNNPDNSWNWMPGIQYEPLTIVKYADNSYTSKKLVPGTVGTPNLNPDYWALTGNTSGAVAALQEQVNALSIESDAMQSDITKIKSKISSMGPKKILWIGDSYTVGQGISSSFAYYVKNFVEGNGGLFNISAHGGAGFTVGAKTFLQLLEEAPIADYDEIYVQGFGNDSNSSSNSIIAAIGTFASRCRQLYPATMITAVPLSKTVENNININSVIYQGCRQNNIKCALKLYPLFLLKSQVQDDLVHPNSYELPGLVVLDYIYNIGLEVTLTTQGSQSYQYLYGDFQLIDRNFRANCIGGALSTITSGTLYDANNYYFLKNNGVRYVFQVPMFYNEDTKFISLDNDRKYKLNGTGSNYTVTTLKAPDDFMIPIRTIYIQ